MSNFNKYWTARENSKNAEVFTPSFLIREMLDKIPDEIWKSPDTTFLDPCFGSGSFPKCIAEKLREFGHSDENISKRIWGIDISRKWYNRVKHFRVGEYNIKNIYCDDSLNTNILDNMKFDVVCGNPPFQPFGSSGTGNKIWPKFVEIGFKVLKEDGWISMITPNHWRLLKSERGVHREAQRLMWENNIVDVQPANKFFDVGGVVKMDYWIITKNKNIKGLEISEDLRKIMFLPENNEKMILSFFEDAEKEDNIYIRSLPQNDNRNFDSLIKKKEGDDSHPYPHISTLPQYEEGLFDWYDQKTKGFDSKKVMVFRIRSKNRRALYDGGGIGCGHQASGYLINSEEEGKKLEKFLNNSKIIKALEEEGKIGFTIPVHFFNKIPKSWVERFNKGEDL